MNLNLSVSQRLKLGFSAITLVVLISYIAIFFSFQESKNITEDNQKIYNPSRTDLQELYILISNSKLLVKNWVFIERHSDTPDKLKLKKLHEKDYPEISKKLEKLEKYWTKHQRESFDAIQKTIKDTLFVQHQNIMEQLNSFESYEDPMIVFEINPLVEEDGEVSILTESILSNLDEVISEIAQASEEKNISIRSLPSNDLSLKIDTDGEKLKRILKNLISNAVKYTSEGSVECGYSTKDEAIEFFVKDTGIGISPEMHNEIFNQFRQNRFQIINFRININS